MQPIRILIVTHSPLSAEFGAGQVAINLAQALRAKGHDVTLWSPHPLPPQTRWWQSIQQMRSKLDAFIKTQEPFDVIDIFPVLITEQVGKSALVVARSVQPDILYLAHSLHSPLKRSLKEITRFLFLIFYSLYQGFLVIQGWRRANYILCLGSLELLWMKKWFFWWQYKLGYYVNALAKTDQIELNRIRLNRQKQLGNGIRFLWIGRWVSHKGITKLLDFIDKRAISHPQDTFTIAGCGTDAERDCSPDLLRSCQLTLIPTFERKQLYSLLVNHDVGLFTSKVEGWGLVLNEMLESGMSVFATSAGGVIDLQPFFEKTLISFPPSWKVTPEILANSANIEDYYQTFSWEKIAESYTVLILTILVNK